MEVVRKMNSFSCYGKDFDQNFQKCFEIISIDTFLIGKNKARITYFFSIQMIYTIATITKSKLNKHTTEQYLIFGDQIRETEKINASV